MERIWSGGHRCLQSLWAVTVDNFHTVSSSAKLLTNLLRNHHGAVLAARTTKSDRQVAFAFMNVVRKQIHQKIGDAGDKLLSLRERAYVFRDARVASGQRAELGDKMWIRKKA